MKRRLALGALAAALALGMGMGVGAQAAPILGTMTLDFTSYIPTPPASTDLTTVTAVDFVSSAGTHTALVNNQTLDFTGIPTGTVATFTTAGHDVNIVGGAPGPISYTLASNFGSFVSADGGTFVGAPTANFAQIVWTGTFTPGSALPGLQPNPLTTLRLSLNLSTVAGSTSYSGGITQASPQAAVPEPSTVLGLLCGLPFLGLVGYRSLRRRAA
jgi:hypothetical protein